MCTMVLPPGLQVRPLNMDDAVPVARLRRAAEVHDVAEAITDDEDIIGDWQRPSFNLAGQSIGVLDGGGLVAHAEVFRSRYVQATVHPDHRRRGIGEALAGWAQERARADGGTLVGQTVPSGGDAEHLLERLGYHERWTAWVLELPDGSVIEPQNPEPGYAIREMRAGDELAAYQLIEDAFNEWPDRQPQTFDDWAAGVVLRPGFEPWQLRLMCDPVGTPIGVSFLILSGEYGYVDCLAVRGDVVLTPAQRACAYFFLVVGLPFLIQTMVCGVHLGVVRGALEELGAGPDRTERTALQPFSEPGACRLALLARSATGR